MARVVKNAEVRREELLDAAHELFSTVGYERTSVQQITDAVGVAKGTFYHYFESKQDLLAQLVDRFAGDLFDQLDKALRKIDDDALHRLRAFFTLSTQWKMERRAVTIAFGEWLFLDDNLPLLHKLMNAWFERTRQMLFEIVEQGAREGMFHVADPRATSDVVLWLWYGSAEHLAELLLGTREHPKNVDALSAALCALETAQERILGLPDSSLGLKLDSYLEGLTGRD